MKDRDRIESDVQKTLDVLDTLQRVPGNPYLYTRLKARMAAPTGGIRRGVLAGQLALTALVLALNAVFLYRQWHPSAKPEALPEALAKEWGLDRNADVYFLTYNAH